jgi:hypothetical protein
MKTTMILKLFMLLLIIDVLAGSYMIAQKRCEDCARRAILDEFTNPNNPDYEQKREEWRQCMHGILDDYVSFEANDPVITSAAVKCEQYKPTDNVYCFPAIVAAYLGEHLTNPCFHMLSLQYFNPDQHRNPEYLFWGTYEGNLEGGRIVEAVTDVWKPIIRRMKMQLYYNGRTPELVCEWNSEGTLNSPRGLLDKLNLPKNINPLLQDFEKRPVKCEVQLPPTEEICRNGAGEIVLTNFTDIEGKPSKPFNRIIVSINKGEILNGERSDFGPDWRVFTLEQGEIKVEYRAPADKDDGYDWLRIYSSCDILPPEKFPMSATQMNELIYDQHFPIFCGFYEGSVTVIKSWDFTRHYDSFSLKQVGIQTVSFNGIFKPIPQMEGLEGQPITIYGPYKVTGTWSHNEDHYCNGDCSCSGLDYQVFGSGDFPEESLQGLIIITYIFPTDEKVVADQLGQFGLVNWYDIGTPTENVPIQTKTKSYNKETGCQWDQSEGSTNLTGSDARFKIRDINHLKGDVSWSSSIETTGVRITDMTEAIYEQIPFDPKKDGTDYHYTVRWDLKAL